LTAVLFNNTLEDPVQNIGSSLVYALPTAMATPMVVRCSQLHCQWGV